MTPPLTGCRRRWWLPFALVFLVACSDDQSHVESTLPEYTRAKPLRSVLHIASSEVLGSLVREWVAGFRQHHPELRVSLEVAGSKQAALALAGGAVDLAALSREITQDEADRFVQAHGYAPTALLIGRDAVTVYVHDENPITALTLAQLDAVFSTTRLAGYPRRITTWTDLGLSGDWAGAPIHLYGLEASSSTSLFFQETVLLGGSYKPDMQVLPSSTMLVSAILVDRFGIGFGPIAHNRPGVRALPLALTLGQAPVSPSQQSVDDGSYPLSRQLYVYVNRSPTLPPPLPIVEFLDYIRSREGHRALVGHGFFPVPLQ
ncbi:PstS family phosphate ABC transporter substrate-binding protein [Candidatus Nitrospira bockiana]